jgi:hypothetical protein
LFCTDQRNPNSGTLITADVCRITIIGYPQTPNYATADFGGSMDTIHGVLDLLVAEDQSLAGNQARTDARCSGIDKDMSGLIRAQSARHSDGTPVRP